jgi:hypothetical protein
MLRRRPVVRRLLTAASITILLTLSAARMPAGDEDAALRGTGWSWIAPRRTAFYLIR